MACPVASFSRHRVSSHMGAASSLLQPLAGQTEQKQVLAERMSQHDITSFREADVRSQLSICHRSGRLRLGLGLHLVAAAGVCRDPPAPGALEVATPMAALMAF